MVLYSRAGCHLCDDAAALVTRYSQWLPPVEVVDIDADPQLKSRFDTCVPVLVCDGKLRFQGRVEERLLRRLIQGTPPLR